MFQVNVERSSQDDIPINCSYKFSAESKCIVNSLETEYKCEIDFAVSSCPQLTLQQVQEADYRIGILVENSIGVSLTSQGHVLCKYYIACMCMKHLYVKMAVLLSVNMPS